MRTILLFFTLALWLGLTEALTIELKKDNFVSLREAIDQDVSSRLLAKLNTIEAKHDILYLYINSPGGDVMAGFEIINYIKSLQDRSKQVVCIAHNAMSMAFAIFQYCTHRYILYASTLMQHQMSLQVKGKLYDINSRMQYLNVIEHKINQDQATRLNMSVANFTKLIQNDWWLYGEEILQQNAADKVVSLACAFDNYEENVVIQTLFGDVQMKYSACPLINYPIQVTYPSINFSENNKMDFMNKHVNFMNMNYVV
jgi:ATP-dependent Clp protease protease subunit